MYPQVRYLICLASSSITTHCDCACRSRTCLYQQHIRYATSRPVPSCNLPCQALLLPGEARQTETPDGAPEQTQKQKQKQKHHSDERPPYCRPDIQSALLVKFCYNSRPLEHPIVSYRIELSQITMAARILPTFAATRALSRPSVFLARQIRNFQTTSPRLETPPVVLPVRKPVGAFRGRSVHFSFLQ